MGNIPCSLIGIRNIVKMSILAKYRVNVIPIQVPMISFAEVEKPILKFIWNLNRPQIAETILKNKTRVLTTPDLIMYCNGTVIQPVWC